ncbi:UDP-glucose dehydrogenase family protein [Marinospirillum insulare]|uniref:UDP-glucose 6-dehydrogenase n=1 Tax=Marinospirillum insulare TaxID=217169 RepID=A0ABQ5ZUX1_9GAMM|nr:nucleotide sugar dehydrogenase [Marinospirillum insulare]GLR62850.1 nucleotide sugar dehydrogenase [Marinospirillum insulare]
MHLVVAGSSLSAQVTAAALASTGHQVLLYLDQPQHFHSLEQGRSLWREPGLDEFFSEQLNSGRLEISLNYTPTASTQRVFLAMAPNQQDEAVELIKKLAATPETDVLLINQSTFPVGTTEYLEALLQTAGKASAKRVAVSLPDLLQEGSALIGFTRPNHLLLGCSSDWAEKEIREILRPFNRRRDNLMVMTPREAEFTKLAITGMLATRLSFMNDLANLADSLQVDIEQVRQGVGADQRIGEHYLYPGCGFGGLSFSRDVMSLAHSLESSGVGSDLLEEVLAINERQKELLFRKLWKYFNTQLQDKTFAIWGAAFKPGSDRIDNAPVLRLLEALWAQGAKVKIHDPKAMPALREWAGQRNDIEFCDTPYDALKEADALLLVTEWKNYWTPDFAQIKASLKQPVILDGRNIYDPNYLRSQGFTYFGVGR